MIDWDKLRVFYAAATAGSFTQAAERLHTTQSALSRSIQTLEHQINAKLFHRLPRGVALTKQGEILFQAVHQMVSNVEEAQAIISAGDKEPRGPLKVVSTFSIASAWLTTFVPDFIDRYPHIRISIVANNETLDLQHHHAEAAIRPYIAHQPDMIQIFLKTFHMRLYASPQYLKRYGVPKRAEDLDQHRLITFGGDSLHPYSNINWILRAGASSKGLRTPCASINSSEGLLKLAKGGLGIVELAEGYPEAEGANLVQVLPDLEGPKVDLYYVYPEKFQTLKRVSLFGEYLAERLKEQKGFSA